MNRLKRLISLTVFIILTFSLFTCCQSKTGKNGEINVICWTEYLPEDVLDEFEIETGIKVNMTLYTSPDEMLAKVQSSSAGTYDMIIGPEDYMSVLKEEGLLEKINYDNIDNYKNIDKMFTSRKNDPVNEYSIPYMITSVVVAVNKEKIKDEITSYKDLLNPDYKDSMVVIEETRAIMGVGLMVNGYDINDCSDEALTSAIEYLNELKPNVHAFNGDSPKTLLINGECSIGILYGGECSLAIDENPNIVGIYPEEGIYCYADEMMKAAGTNNSENVDKFMNYILDSEVSAQLSETYPYINPNKEARKHLGDEYLNNPIKNITKEDWDKTKQVVNLGDNLSKVVDLWTSFKVD